MIIKERFVNMKEWVHSPLSNLAKQGAQEQYENDYRVGSFIIGGSIRIFSLFAYIPASILDLALSPFINLAIFFEVIKNEQLTELTVISVEIYEGEEVSEYPSNQRLSNIQERATILQDIEEDLPLPLEPQPVFIPEAPPTTSNVATAAKVLTAVSFLAVASYLYYQNKEDVDQFVINKSNAPFTRTQVFPNFSAEVISLVVSPVLNRLTSVFN